MHKYTPSNVSRVLASRYSVLVSDQAFTKIIEMAKSFKPLCSLVFVLVLVIISNWVLFESEARPLKLGCNLWSFYPLFCMRYIDELYIEAMKTNGFSNSQTLKRHEKNLV